MRASIFTLALGAVAAAALYIILGGGQGATGTPQQTRSVRKAPDAQESTLNTRGREGRLRRPDNERSSHRGDSNSDTDEVEPAPPYEHAIATQLPESDRQDQPHEGILVNDVLSVFRENDGSLEERGPIVDGEREGIWESFSSDGTLILEGRYVAGVAQGPWTAWYDDGSKASQSFVRDGQLSGRCLFWTHDGSLDPIRSGIYDNGNKVDDIQ